MQGVLAKGQHMSNVAHRHAIGDGEQYMHALDQSQRAAGISLVETMIKLLTRAVCETYGTRYE